MADKTISIGFKIEDGAGGFKELTVSADALRKAMGAAVVEAERLNAPMLNLGALTSTLDSIKGAFSDIAGICSDLTDAYTAQAEVETQLEAVMRRTMDATDAEIQSIKDLTAAQQNLGVVGDEVQLAGAQELSTYLEKKESLERLIPVMNDMLAQQYGLSASQENAAQIATMLGKVMNGQVGALSRYGYSFDEAQAEILKFGTEAERAAVLCDVVSESVGGMNAALAQTESGQLQQVKNALGDIKEQIGGAVKNFMPYIEGMNQCVEATSSLITTCKGFRLVVTQVKAMVTAFRAASIAAKAFQLAVGGIVVTGIVIALEALYQNLKDVTAVSRENAEVQKTINSIRSEAAQRAAEQKVQIDLLVGAARNEKLSLDERQAAINKLNSIIPGYNAYLDATTGKYRENKEALDEYLRSLQRQYELEGAKSKLSELGGAKADAKLRRAEAIEKFEKEKGKYQELQATYEATRHEYGVQSHRTTGAHQAVGYQKRQMDAAWQEVINTTKEVNEAITKSSAVMKMYSSELYSSAVSSSSASSSTTPTTQKTTPSPTRVRAVTETAPEGSMAAMRATISDLDKKINFAIDPAEIAVLEQQKEAIEEQIGDLEFRARIAKDGWGIDTGDIPDAEIPVTIDTGALDAKLQDLPKQVRKSTAGLPDMLGNVATAFSAIGDAVGGAAGSWLSFTATALQGIAQILPQLAALIGGEFALAMASGTKSGASLPFPANIAAIASIVATIAGVMAGIPKFADGGIAYGPTLGLFGEYANARTNPEVVAPLSRLRDMIGEGGGGLEVATVRIKGNDLEYVLRRTMRKMSRT